MVSPRMRSTNPRSLWIFPSSFIHRRVCTSHQCAPIKNLLPIYPCLTLSVTLRRSVFFSGRRALFCPANDRRPPRKKRFNLRFPLHLSRSGSFNPLTSEDSEIVKMILRVCNVLLKVITINCVTAAFNHLPWQLIADHNE